MILHIDTILDYLSGSNYSFTYYGNKQLKIIDFCSLNNPKQNSITWIKNYSNFHIGKINKGLELLIITDDKEFKVSHAEGYNVVICENPKEIFFGILSEFFIDDVEMLISPNSIIETVKIGKNVSIGHNCYISKDVTIGDNVTIKNNVVIEYSCLIGRNTIINSGVVIGTDGFGYYKTGDGTNKKVPHFGGVVIGEDVEIGANTCIDRGTLDDTVIENNVKIDNLSMIAHNARIGSKTMLLGQSGVAGSCFIGENTYIGPGAKVKNQIRIGNNSMVGMGVMANKDLEDNTLLAGSPAKKFKVNYLDILGL